MAKIMKMIAVHHANKNGRGEAACFVAESAALEMIEAGLAQWGNKKQSYLNLKKTEASMTPTARSLKMGEDIIFLNALGDESAMALVAGWYDGRPLLKAA